MQQDFTSLSQTVKQRQFSKDEFHYLNVTRVESFDVYDIFDCIFECLSNPLWFSFNFVASKGKDGKLWCDLLSSDKYRDFRDSEYNENMTSHHFFTVVGFLIPTLFIYTDIATMLQTIRPSFFSYNRELFLFMLVTLFFHAMSKWRYLCDKLQV